MIRNISPRQPTENPLVEVNSLTGVLTPTGRRLDLRPRNDNRNCWGLTDAEQVVFTMACDVLLRNPDRVGPPSLRTTAAENQAATDHEISAEGLPVFIEHYRLEYPLPTSFSTLEYGDPAANTETIAVDAAPLGAYGNPQDGNRFLAVTLESANTLIDLVDEIKNGVFGSTQRLHDALNHVFSNKDAESNA